MSLKNETELANTKAKLATLEERYEAVRTEEGDTRVRELTLRSLKATINQFKEEIARYEASRAERKAG